jgi:4-hydroxy-3-methylbut-2-enyl diphosphate reductase
VEGEVHLVASVADVEALEIAADRPMAYVTQTTLSVDDTRAIIEALRARFHDIQGPDTRDICYATQNRQVAVRELARRVDVVLVVGAANSSNSNRLREIGAEGGKACHLIPDAGALRRDWFEGAAAVGITAGASAPERLVREVVAQLAAWWPGTEVSALPGIVEDVQFKLPAALAEERSSAAA